jgi:hypothetical protein
MTTYKGGWMFGPHVCERCLREINGEWWLNFSVDGERVGNICGTCRCAVMADYIIPCAYRDDASEWHVVDSQGSESGVGAILRRAAERLRLERTESAPSATDPREEK